MAFRSFQLLGFRAVFRYRLLTPPSFSSFPSPLFHIPYSSIPCPFALPDLKTSTPDPLEAPLARGVADHLLSPVEKLRGVFLQKLVGRFAVESALSSTGVDLTPEIFAGVVNRGNMGGAAMLSFFNWAIRQPNLPCSVDTYNTIIKALGRRKFFEFMEEVLFRMKKEGVNPDSKTVAIVLDCYVSARRVRKAVEMFERLEEIGGTLDGESLGALLRSLCRWSHVKLAKSYLNKVRGKIPFDATAYNEIIGGWAKLGRLDEVEGSLRAMVDDGFDPDSQTNAHVICGLGRASRLDDALVFFQEKGCDQDIVTYGMMISNLIRAGDLDKGMEVLKKMVEQNCVPNSELYAKLICALLKVRRVADALEVFEDMLSRGVHPSTGMITSFIERLCSYGPPYAAMLIYTKSKKIGCILSVKAYKLLLRRLSRKGKCGTVLKIWKEMQECGYPADVEVYECIVDGLCSTGKLDSAVLLVEESLRNGFCIRGVTYSKLSNKLLALNKVETAYKLYLKVKEARRRANMQRTWRYKGWHF